MSQIEKNKAEVFEWMKQLANEPLNPKNIRDLDTLMGAYNALCLVEREWRPEEHEEPAEPVRAHQRAPQTA